MCTRFHLKPGSRELRKIAERALASRLAGKVRDAGKTVAVEGDIRPTDVAPVLAPGRNGGRGVFPMRWGFRLPGGGLVVNARTETAAGKPLFGDSWARRRCVVPASWYYEWEHTADPSGKKRVGAKYRIFAPGAPVLWLCGLYRMEGDVPVFAILTRPPTPELARLHDRMPFILSGELAGEWIRPDARPEDFPVHAVEELAAVAVPAGA